MSTIKTVNVRELDVITLEDAEIVAGDPERIAAAIGVPTAAWGGRCHEISLAVLRTGLFGRGRMARGTCPGVISQHSWFILGDDPYDEDATGVDPVLQTCRDDVDGIAVFRGGDLGHRPHGSGSCYAGGMPYHHGGPDIELTPAKPLTVSARHFLAHLLPLDYRGWAGVAHMGVEGWPAAEIITAMCDTEGLGVLIPIDIRGMLTDTNPNDLYW
jgi:hypothetical protein